MIDEGHQIGSLQESLGDGSRAIADGNDPDPGRVQGLECLPCIVTGGEFRNRAQQQLLGV
ncbi:hypothetical protein [Bradyrhizobium sp.]|uniref:hypothetical protein n=1 Tax=Bradyrhizobium sp. TaxID=376 RepID=UPI004037A0F5